MWSGESAYGSIVSQWSRAYDVPEWVILATIGKESGFNPTAFRAEPQIADASRGLMQLLFGTAKDLGYKGIAGDDSAKTGGLYEPSVSVQLGTKYLAKQRARYPSAPWREIYAAYNAGSIRRDATGALVNEANVKGWDRAAAHFATAAAVAAPPESGTPAPPDRVRVSLSTPALILIALVVVLLWSRANSR